jgi:hypothetical protein
MSQLSNLPHVTEVNRIEGPYDIIVKLSDDSADLSFLEFKEVPFLLCIIYHFIYCLISSSITKKKNVCQSYLCFQIPTIVQLG